jgi:hypothetical protein
VRRSVAPARRSYLASRQGGDDGQVVTPRVASERRKVQNQVRELSRPSVPSYLNRAAQDIASGEQEHAERGGLFGFLEDIPVVGPTVIDPALDVLESQPVQSVLRTVDIGRAAVVSGLNEAFEEAGLLEENDQSFTEQFNRRMSFREMVDFPEWAEWAEPIAGFAGDVVFDPTSYIGVGLAAKGARGALGAAGVAGRRELAEHIIVRAGQSGLDDVGMAAAERLAAEAGMRGRGAITRQGLRRAGVTDDVARQLGIGDFGIELRIPYARTSVGGRRVIEAAENLKGAVKMRMGRTAGGRILRSTRAPDFDAALTDVLFSGKGTAHQRANAARVLAATHIGRGESSALIDKMSRWIRSELRPTLKQRGDVDWEDAFSQIETKNITSPAAQKLHEFYETLADAAEAAGIQMDRRANYVPHRLTLAARELMKDPEQVSRLGFDPRMVTEEFQKPRSIAVGDKFFGEEVKTATLRELNDISKRRVGFEWFETNPDKLIAISLSEIGEVAESSARGRALKMMGAPVEEVDRVVKDISEIDPKTAQRIKNLNNLAAQARRNEAKAYRLAARERQYAVQAATRAVRARGRKVEGELTKAENAIDRVVAEADALAKKKADATSALETANAALEQASRRSQTAARGAKQAAQRKVDQLRDEVARRQSQLESVTARYQQAVTDASEAETLFAQAVQRHMDEARLAAVAAGRRFNQTAARKKAVEEAAEQGVKVTEAQRAVEAAQKAKGRSEAALGASEEALTRGREDVAKASAQMAQGDAQVMTLRKSTAKMREKLDAMDAKERALGVEDADAMEMIPQLEARAEELEAAIGIGTETLEKSKKPRWKLESKTERAVAEDLAEKARMMSELLQREGMDKITYKMAEYEAKSLAHQMDAVRFADEAAMRMDTIKMLQNDKVRRVVVQKIKDGFKDIGGGYQVADPDLARQLQNVVSVFESKKATAALWKGWDAWNKWFRTWAVTSPGFISRNIQGAWLNNLMAGVKMADYRDFKKHMSVYRSGSGWEQRFIQRFGREELDRFQGALDAIGGTGWGQSAQEAGIGLFSKRGPRRAWDVTLGTENPASTWVRRRNESAESFMRGAHAYMVFRRLGRHADGQFPVNDAINSVAKWHFNYRDISDFDRWAKRAIPFWTFMSRNLPLQIENLVKHPDVLNRTYGNLQRTLEAGREEDEITPRYFEDLGAIAGGPQLPFVGQESLFLDLPALRVQEDIQKFSDLERLFADANPLIRVPAEMRANRQFFSGIPLDQNRMERVPAVLNAPGIRQVLEGLNVIRPDEEGTQRISDEAAYALGALIPLFSRGERLFPTVQRAPGEEGYERERDYARQKSIETLISTFLGVGVRGNTPERQQGEMLRRSRELKVLLDEAKELGYL